MYYGAANTETDVAKRICRDFDSLRANRHTWETHWDEIAELVMPIMKNTFRPGDRNTPGEKKTIRQLDATPEIASHQFGAILDSLLTPKNQMWHRLRAQDRQLARSREVRLYFEDTALRLFDYRYDPISNFPSQNQAVYNSLGVFGTAGMYVDKPYGRFGLRYKAIPVGQLYIRENHQGLVDTVYRLFKLKPHQAIKQFGKDVLPEDIVRDAEKSPDKEYEFLHYVGPREDLDLNRMDARGKVYQSVYISLHKKQILSEGGYNVMPYIVTRYEQAPGETYGRSPAMLALPAIKTLMDQKRVVLKQGQRAVDPIYLAHDDGIMNGFKQRPGAVNYGAMSADGRRLVDALPPGNVQLGRDMMDDERAVINSAFLVHLFQILAETPRMTATEVIERTREKGILLAPTVGRQESEYLGPLIERELDVLSQQGLLPPLPEELAAAGGDYVTIFDSPLSRMMRAEEVAGFIRTTEAMLPVVNATGDPSVFDNYDMDTIARDIAEIQAMPERWMKAQELVEEIRAQRREMMEREQQVREAPGAAALISAQAKAQQAQAA